MTDDIPAKSFVYTAAPFGHDGINGFQFVGLPADGASPELIEAVAEHVRYTAPLGVPSQPTDEEIARHFPLSTRIVAGAPGNLTLLVQSRYIGQVYQSEAKRGKWGNFIAHARAIPADAATVAALIGIARTADWRDGMSDAELAVAKALDLPDERLSPPPALNTPPLNERDRAAGVAAILARLDGDLALLLPDTEPDQALAMFEDLASQLPDVLGRRLSWTSFEFDAGPGYDILATIGDTRLTSDANAYLRLDSPPDDPIYLWAGQSACRDGAAFWTRLALFSDLSVQTRLADVLGLVRRVDEAGPDTLDPVHEALALLRKGPADPQRIAAADAIFARSFGSLRDAEADNFAFLVSAGNEALALSKWSGSHRLWQEVIGWAETFPSLNAEFEPVGVPGLLSNAMSRAISTGSSLDHILDMVLAASNRNLSQTSVASPLATAIFMVLPDGGHSTKSAQTILRIAGHHLKSPGHATLIAELLIKSGASAGFDWLKLVSAELPKVAPDLADRLIPSLEIGILEALADKPDNIAEVTQRVIGLAPLLSDKARNERLERLLERLDATLPKTGRQQAKIATALVKAAKAQSVDPGSTPNALALQAIISKPHLATVLDDPNIFSRIQRATARDVYIALFDKAFTLLKPQSMQGSAKEIKGLWRGDIRDHFVDHTARHFLSGVNRAILVECVDDAIMAHSRTKGGGQPEDDWARICETVALHLCTKLDRDSFDKLAWDYPTSTVVAAMARRRNRGMSPFVRSIGGAIRGLFSLRKGGE